MSVSLLELCPSSSAPALTLSDRGGARFGVGGVAGLDGVESGDCEFAGAGLDGLEFCAHAATQHASNGTRRKLRIDYFIALRGWRGMTAGISARCPTRKTGCPLVR